MFRFDEFFEFANYLLVTKLLKNAFYMAKLDWNDVLTNEIVYLLSLFNIGKSKLFVNFVAFLLEVYCDPVKLQPSIQIISRPDKYISTAKT